MRSFPAKSAARACALTVFLSIAVCAPTALAQAPGQAPSAAPAGPASDAPAPPAPPPVYPAPSNTPPPWLGAPPGEPPPSMLDSEAYAAFKRKKSFILGGAIVLGLGYYASLVLSSVASWRGGRNSREYIPGLFPIVGPFISAGMRADPNPTLNNQTPTSDIAGTTIYLAFGIIQSVGAGVLIAGLRMPSGKSPPRCLTSTAKASPCPSAQLSLSPIITPTMAGGGLSGSF